MAAPTLVDGSPFVDEYDSNSIIKEHVTRFGCLVFCVDRDEKLKQEARSDWLTMIFPSIFTKTFGRALMVTGHLPFHTFSQFILLNMWSAALPIAAISSVAVGSFNLFKAYCASFKTTHPLVEFTSGYRLAYLRLFFSHSKDFAWKSNLKSSGILLLKTAVKFFMVYMGWASAMGLVMTLGWSVAFTFPYVAMAVGCCIAGMLLFQGIKYLLNRFVKSKVPRIALNILTVTCGFGIVAALGYLLGPVFGGLLIVGGITAFALMLASFITDVLPDLEVNKQKPWKLAVRAYLEGVVWAFAERLGISQMVTGAGGELLDVGFVASAVCLAIYIAGQIDGAVRHVVNYVRHKLSNDEATDICNAMTSIQRLDVIDGWPAICEQILVIHRNLGNFGARHLFDRYIKQELGLKVLEKLNHCESEAEIDQISKEVHQFIRNKRAISWLPFSISIGLSKTDSFIRQAVSKRRELVRAEESDKKSLTAAWKVLSSTIRCNIEDHHTRAASKINDKYTDGRKAIVGVIEKAGTPMGTPRSTFNLGFFKKSPLFQAPAVIGSAPAV